MKAKTCQINVSTLVTLVLLLVRKTLSSLNPSYLACKPFECGSLSISYPFFVTDIQPSFCGSEEFGVSCNSKNQTVINLSNDDYIINSILYENLSMSITNSAFSDSVFTCLSSVNNLSLGPQIKFSLATTYEQKELILLENCSRNLSSNKNYTSIKCKGDKSNDTIFAVYKEDFKQEEVEKCNETVTVHYDGKSKYAIKEGILRQGIIVEYSANNCSVCKSSGEDVGSITVGI